MQYVVKVSESERSAFMQHHHDGALTLEAINRMEMEVSCLLARYVLAHAQTGVLISLKHN